MTDAQPPSHRSLPADLRYLRAALADTDIPPTAARLLDEAIRRADTEGDQARIWHAEAADRENALELVRRVRDELDRLPGLLPDPHGPGAQYAEGAIWVIRQLREALNTDQADTSAANTGEIR